MKRRGRRRPSELNDRAGAYPFVRLTRRPCAARALFRRKHKQREYKPNRAGGVKSTPVSFPALPRASARRSRKTENTGLSLKKQRLLAARISLRVREVGGIWRRRRDRRVGSLSFDGSRKASSIEILFRISSAIVLASRISPSRAAHIGQAVAEPIVARHLHQRPRRHFLPGGERRQFIFRIHEDGGGGRASRDRVDDRRLHALLSFTSSL